MKITRVEAIHLRLPDVNERCDGSQETLGAAVGTMYAVKAQAQTLMQMPDGDGTVAGPTFEYVRPEFR